MQFSSVFKMLCKKSGVTQKKALSDMGLGENSNQRWTKGWPSLETLAKVSTYFKIPMENIIRMISIEEPEGFSEYLEMNNSNINESAGSIVATGGSVVTTGQKDDVQEDKLTEQERYIIGVFRRLDFIGQHEAVDYFIKRNAEIGKSEQN